MTKDKPNPDDPNAHTTQGDQLAEKRIKPTAEEPAAGENDFGPTRHADVAHDVKQEDQPVTGDQPKRK